MRAAIATRHFGTAHAKWIVFVLIDSAIIDTLIEAWPAATGVKLIVRLKQAGTAAFTAVDTFIIDVVINASKWALCALLAHDVILIGSEARFPICVGQLADFFFA